jgi:hypothetical protein
MESKDFVFASLLNYALKQAAVGARPGWRAWSFKGRSPARPCVHADLHPSGAWLARVYLHRKRHYAWSSGA